jgi:Spy/CpxP family protein refolding chaperone
MSHIENSPEAMNIKAFLAESRNYLALNDSRSAAERQTTVSTVTTETQRSTMNSYRKLAQSLLLVAGLGAVAAGPVMADPGCGPMGSHQERHAHMKEQHHKQLHDALKLTPEQEPAWAKLMESEQARPALSGGQPEDWAKLKAPERAEKMLELMKGRQAQMTEHVAALKTFYATLTPAQQATFDEHHAAPRRGMRGKAAPTKP